MGRKPCCEKIGLKRGPWDIEEDRKLVNFIFNNGIQCWRNMPKRAGLLRCGKSCRLRWINYLRPDLKRGGFTETEDDQLIKLHSQFGNRWSKIASHFPGRTDNEIKNHWNTRIKKKLKLNDAKLNIDQPNSSGESSDNTFGFESQQKSPASDEKCTISEKVRDDLIRDIELLWENLDSGSPETASIENSETMDEYSLQSEDYFQQWINDEMESMLLWEDLQNLEGILL